MPAGSKMDLLLAKAEPISDGGSASGITELRRRNKKPTKGICSQRGVRICERNNSAPRSVQTEGEEVLQAPEPRFPCGEDHGEAGCPLQPMEVHGGADIHLQPTEAPMPEQVDAPKEGCDPVGSPCWSKLLAAPVAPWREEPTSEQVCWQDL
ncbi:hypothetical protein GRJ2_000780700 [Grus japonensis]|uniref:Uncharacterized protein n=1 Tax=Grus japonensis TaxID=30415 RepID=A0ABC9WCA0_GRUJA